MTGASAVKHAAKAPELPRFRAPIVFGFLLLLFLVLVGRSLYLQWIDNAFLQEQGTSRYSREIELPAHRGRILDRSGEPLAISTPVKSIWAFSGQVDASPEKLAQLARLLETTPKALAKRLEEASDFVFLAKQVPPEVAERVAGLRIKGVHDQNEYRRFYPTGEMASHIVGFTGDHDVGQEGMELTQQEWLGGKPGSRRVLINRRGEVVEDVESIRAPQPGRDLALSIDARLQYLAFRELRTAVEANKAKAGGLVILDAQTGEILALANWPTYNPNARNRVAREKMRNRALTDVFRARFDAQAVHDRGGARERRRAPRHRDPDGARLDDDRPQHHSRRASSGRAVRRAGDPEVVQRRRREDRAVAAAGDDVADALGRGLRHGAQHRISGRGRRPIAARKDVEADRAGHDGLRPRHFRQPRPACARLYRVCDRGSVEAGNTVQGGDIRGGPAGDEARDRARRAPYARARRVARRHGAEGADSRISSGGQDGHRAQAGGPRLHQQIRFVLRRIRSCVRARFIVAVMIDEPAAGAHYGGDVAAPVFSTVMGSVLRTLGVPPDAPSDNVILPDAAAAIREET
jgi:cell division protein FtsI (penicillin-binding protein 3)